MTRDTTRDTLFLFAIALGACLLFQVQFLLARVILPWFGGAPAVWSTSLVLFQALLLVGYAWAHGLARLQSRRSQAMAHALLLTAILMLLAWRAASWPSPVTPGSSWKPAADAAPVWAISALLLASVGAPFVALAAASPLLQRWRADLAPGTPPYRLYAASNAGSLVGLVSYPLVVEPSLDLVAQGRWWTVGYVAFAAATLACASLVGGRDAAPAASPADDRPPTGHERLPSRLAWIALAAVPAALLQATTTLLTQDIAAVPFLWMVPLALYLLTYIVAFERPAACPRAPLAVLLVLGGLLGLGRWPTSVTLAHALAMLTVTGLTLHGELARRAPPAAHLTRYYLAVAFGGVVGSALVAFGAPLAFTRVVEYPVTMTAALGLLAVLIATARTDRAKPRQRLLAESLALTGLLIVGATAAESRLVADQVTHASRNFFGTVRVREMTTPDGARYRRFIHGTTLHGLQFLDEGRRREPTTYFTASSGVGRAMAALTSRPGPVRVAVIGLGIGTLAAYGRPGDRFDFYEIDPQVVALSSGERPVFTYLRDSAATVTVAVGDGRLTLERASPLGADMVVMDAFGSDAVPVHLMTSEAIAAYARHLRAPDGLLAVNISNRFLALTDVVAASGAAQGFSAVEVDDDPGPGLVKATRWMLLCRDASRLAGFGPLVPVTSPAWTDASSDALRVLRWR